MSVDRGLSRNWRCTTTYWWITRDRHYHIARFSQWQSSGLFQDGLWRFMAVHGAESESSSFKESLASSLGYRAFYWCCLSVLGEWLSCLLQQRSTWKHPRVGEYKNALQHDKLVNSSWSVVKFDEIVPHLQLLILPAIKCGPYITTVWRCFTAKRPLVCILYTRNVKEQRTTRTNHAAAVNNLSWIYQNPLREIKVT